MRQTPSFKSGPRGHEESTHHALRQRSSNRQQHRAAQEKCGAPHTSESPYQQRTTERENPAQQLIKQAVDFLIQQLEAGKSETLTAYLAAMARFHQYSFGNILAIARQRPTATRVAGFHTWKELGRFVKKGEKGIQILAPMIAKRRRKDAAEQEYTPNQDTKPAPMLIGFRAVYVFDVAQTEGAELPEFEHNISGEVGAHRERLIAFLECAEYRARIQRANCSRAWRQLRRQNCPFARSVSGPGIHNAGS